MDAKTILSYFGAFAAGAYIYDVLLRPGPYCHAARRAARRRRKPMLNIGCGTEGSSLAIMITGPQLLGDVNMDIAAPKQSCGPDRSCYGDIMNIPYPDKYFGSAFASHVVEHVEDPARAIRELHRVADEVFVVVPKWWAPHTWAHPGHQWFITEDLQAAYPLWKSE